MDPNQNTNVPPQEPVQPAPQPAPPVQQPTEQVQPQSSAPEQSTSAPQEPVAVQPPASTPPPAPQQPAVPTAQAPQQPVQDAAQQPTPVFNQPTKKPKKLKLLIVAVVAALIVGGGVFAAITFFGSSLPLTNYTSSGDLQFSIDYPEGWDVNEDLDRDFLQTVSFEEPINEEDGNNNAQAVMQVFFAQIPEEFREGSSVTKEEFFEQTVESFEQSISKDSEFYNEGDEYGEITNQEEVTVDGYAALRVSINLFNFDDQEGETGSGEVYYIYINDFTQAGIAIGGHSSDAKFIKSTGKIIKSFDYTE